MYEMLIYFILFFILWLYFIHLSLVRKEIGFSYLQFGLVLPLTIFLADNIYINSFYLGWIFVFMPVLTSIIILVTNFNDLNNEK